MAHGGSGTAMHLSPPCPPRDFLEAIALARLILPPEIHVQAPPNLSDDFGVLLDAGAQGVAALYVGGTVIAGDNLLSEVTP